MSRRSGGSGSKANSRAGRSTGNADRDSRAVWASHAEGILGEATARPRSVQQQRDVPASRACRTLQDTRDPTWAHFHAETTKQRQQPLTASHAAALTPWRSSNSHNQPRRGSAGCRSLTKPGSAAEGEVQEGTGEAAVPALMGSSFALWKSQGGARPMSHHPRPDRNASNVASTLSANKQRFQPKGQRWPAKPGCVWDVAAQKWTKKPTEQPDPDWMDDLAVRLPSCSHHWQPRHRTPWRAATAALV